MDTNDYKQQFQTLADNVRRFSNKAATEEATKTAFILPFIKAIGYNTASLNEVIPEFHAPYMKHKDRVDFALFVKEEPVIFVECKQCNWPLTKIEKNQLHSYFCSSSQTKVGILTNGIEYQLYTDIEKPNVMDDCPFLSFDIRNITDEQIETLQFLNPQKFDRSNFTKIAFDIRCQNVIQQHLDEFLYKRPQEFFLPILENKSPFIANCDSRANILKRVLNTMLKVPVADVEMPLSITTNELHTSTEQEYLAFWELFRTECIKLGLPPTIPPARHVDWYMLRVGKSGLGVYNTISIMKKKYRVGFKIRKDSINNIYQYLLEHKKEIESALGMKLDWKEENKTYMISFTVRNLTLTTKSGVVSVATQMAKDVIKFHRVFSNFVKKQ